MILLAGAPSALAGCEEYTVELVISTSAEDARKLSDLMQYDWVFHVHETLNTKLRAATYLTSRSTEEGITILAQLEGSEADCRLVASHMISSLSLLCGDGSSSIQCRIMSNTFFPKFGSRVQVSVTGRIPFMLALATPPSFVSIGPPIAPELAFGGIIDRNNLVLRSFASMLLPGLGQALAGENWKAALYLTASLASFAMGAYGIYSYNDNLRTAAIVGIYLAPTASALDVYLSESSGRDRMNK